MPLDILCGWQIYALSKTNESEFLSFICKNEPYVCFFIIKTQSTAQCPGCQSSDILNAVALLLHFPVRCYKRLQKQLCLHTHTSTYLSSVLRSWNNLADKKTLLFFSPLEIFQAAADFRFGGELHSHLAKKRQHTKMPFGRTRPLQVVSIWRSEWQEEQLSPAICAEWIPGD